MAPYNRFHNILLNGHLIVAACFTANVVGWALHENLAFAAGVVFAVLSWASAHFTESLMAEAPPRVGMIHGLSVTTIFFPLVSGIAWIVGVLT